MKYEIQVEEVAGGVDGRYNTTAISLREARRILRVALEHAAAGSAFGSRGVIFSGNAEVVSGFADADGKAKLAD